VIDISAGIDDVSATGTKCRAAPLISRNLDDYLALSTSHLEVPNRVGDCRQREGLSDEGCELAGLYELFEDEQVLVVLLADERAEFLALGPRQHRRELTADAEPISPTFASDDDESAVGLEHAAQAG